MEMNWTNLKRDMNKKELFDEFFLACVVGKKRLIIDSTLRNEAWKCCLKCANWLIENKAKTETMRLRNRDTGQSSLWTEQELFLALRSFLKKKEVEDSRRKKGVGLVLAGGGARGAYQIGVWRAIREVGMEPMITGISGTSIGAMNALLFALGDYKKAEKLWFRASDPRLRMKERARIEMFSRAYAKRKDRPPVFELLENEFISQPELRNLLTREIAGKAKQVNDRYQIYSTLTPVEEVERLTQNILLNTNWRIQSVPGIHYVSWKTLSADEIVSAILASAAVPIVFDPVEFKGHLYHDGELFDNVPIQPLYACGYRNFLVVHMNRDTTKCSQMKETYSDCGIVQIIPGQEFSDGLFSMLDLTPESTRHRIKLGFRDALRQMDEQLSLVRNIMKGESSI